MPDMALSDVKVLDLTHHIAGPFCTKLLADYGADVIKIERPGPGDPARAMGPFFHDDPHPEKSLLFTYLNINKRGITLNLKSPTGQEVFRELVKGADLVVESFRPHVMGGVGLSYDTLKEINPRLVMTSITSFGQYGPYAEYKATEMVVFGMGGAMTNGGEPEREPVSYGIPTAVYHGGATAAAATVGALFGARWKGIGQHVDVSIMETLLGSVDRRVSSLLSYQYSGERTGRTAFLGGYPAGYYPCKDGYFCIFGAGNFVGRVIQMLDEPEELKDPRFVQPEGQADADLRDLFEAVLLRWSMERTRVEVVAAAAKHRIICSSVNTMEDVAKDPQFNTRGVFVEMKHPVMGRLRSIGRPVAMGETPWQLRRPAPLLGQHNAEVYGELGYDGKTLARLRQAGVI